MLSKIKMVAIGMSAFVAVTGSGLTANAATVDTGNLTYEQLIKTALGRNAGGLGGGLMELLGISGSNAGDLTSLLKGGAFFETEQTAGSIAQGKAIKSIGKLLGVNIPADALSGLPLADENTSKVLLAASKAARGGDIKVSAGTILSVLNNAQQTEIKQAAEKTATDGAVPLAAAVEGANQQIVQATDFVDSIQSADSSLDAMNNANAIAAQDVKLKAAGTGIQAAALSQGKETNQRLGAVAGYLEEQNKRAQAEDRTTDINRSVAAENTARSTAASRALTTGSYNNTKYFNF